MTAFLFASCAKDTSVVNELTGPGTEKDICWIESGEDKYNKMKDIIALTSGTTDTSNVTVIVHNTISRWLGSAQPTGAEEVIQFPPRDGEPQGNWAFSEGSILLFKKDHILSSCTDLSEELGEGVFYIQFYKDGIFLNTAEWKYATPIGSKLTMTL